MMRKPLVTLTVALLMCGICASTLVGGKQSQKVEDPNVQSMVNVAAQKFNERANSLYSYKPVKVLKAETQIVSGVAYYLDVVFGSSACRKQELQKNEKPCELNSKPSYQRCDMVLVHQPWLNPNPELTKMDCRASTSTGQSLNEQKLTKVALHKSTSARSRFRAEPGDKRKLSLFEDFLRKANKSYAGGAAEYLRRFTIFKRNLRIIHQLQTHEKGTAKYGVTRFADMSPGEFAKLVLTPNWKDTGYPTRFDDIPPPQTTPQHWDWRDHDAVTPVKDQGKCGSCWAFSTTGNIEGQWAIKKKRLVSLSEQELVDCDKLDQGCGGGLPSNAYREIERLGGLETEREYPYKGYGEKCVFDRSEARVYINDSVKISQNETAIAAWLAKNGPISIGINAYAMMFYWGGIAHPWRVFCNPDTLNHGVLIVGFGQKDETPFWIIKNSWGESWGERGYYYLYRGKGLCGVNRMPTSAVVR